VKEKAKLKMEAVNDRYKDKFPDAHKKVSHYAGVFSEVWKETFPN